MGRRELHTSPLLLHTTSHHCDLIINTSTNAAARVPGCRRRHRAGFDMIHGSIAQQRNIRQLGMSQIIRTAESAETHSADWVGRTRLVKTAVSKTKQKELRSDQHPPRRLLHKPGPYCPDTQPMRAALRPAVRAVARERRTDAPSRRRALCQKKDSQGPVLLTAIQ